MRLGVLGGTFDPPHYAHLILAEHARDQLDLEQVLWVPAADPPHKRGEVAASVEHRLAMLRLALADAPGFRLSLVDVERPGPHYTADMLDLLQRMHPEVELFFLIGSDSLMYLPGWSRPHEVIRLARLAVMARPGFSPDLDRLEAALPGLRKRMEIVRVPQIDIAAHDIRARVAAGRSIRYLLPQAVELYIKEHGLYLEHSG